MTVEDFENAYADADSYIVSESGEAAENAKAAEEAAEKAAEEAAEYYDEIVDEVITTALSLQKSWDLLLDTTATE